MHTHLEIMMTSALQAATVKKRTKLGQYQSQNGHDQEMLGPKKAYDLKYFGSKPLSILKIMGPTKLLIQTNLGQKIWVQKHFCLTRFWIK